MGCGGSKEQALAPEKAGAKPADAPVPQGKPKTSSANEEHARALPAQSNPALLPEPMKEHKQPQKPPAQRNSMDDDLAEVDRLLTGTKSEIQRNPLPIEEGESPTRANGDESMQRQSTADSAYANPSTRQLTAQLSAAAAADDPWASLQSAYRIRGPEPDPVAASMRGLNGGVGNGSFRPSNRPGAGGRGMGGRGGMGGMRGQNGSGGMGGDVVVLDEDGGLTGSPQQPLYGQRPGPRLAAKAANKQGGWGQGELAQAGTLMVGDRELDELDRLAPTHAPGAAMSPTAAGWQQQGDDPELEVLRSRVKASVAVADLGVEDLEDIDDVMEKEMAAIENAGINPSLAAKLAKFEAMMDGDD